MLESKGFLPDQWGDILEKRGLSSVGLHEIQGLINIAIGTESMTAGDAYSKAREKNGLSKVRGDRWADEDKRL